MKIKYVIFSSFSSNYMNESGYYYRHEMKHFYDGELLSDGSLFDSKEDAINRISELVEFRIYQIIEVYINDFYFF